MIKDFIDKITKILYIYKIFIFEAYIILKGGDLDDSDRGKTD